MKCSLDLCWYKRLELETGLVVLNLTRRQDFKNLRSQQRKNPSIFGRSGALNKNHRAASRSPLARAFDHCPSVLLSFLRDIDAANVVNALCHPRFLTTKQYEIQRELPFRRVLAGCYPCVVRSVMFEGEYDEVSMLSQLPSTVTSMSMSASFTLHWRVRDLPRGLTHFSCRERHPPAFRNIDGPDDWPICLTSLKVDSLGASLPPLPPSLRILDCMMDVPPGDLPNSLTTLRALNRLGRPLSQLPPHITTLSIGLHSGVGPQSLTNLPASLTHLSIHAREETFRNFREEGTIVLPPSLRFLHLSCIPFKAIRSLPPSLEHLSLQCTEVDPSLDDHFGHPPAPAGRPIRHATLRTLSLPERYNRPIRAQDLPSLQALSISSGYHQPLDQLPPSLSELHFWSDSDQRPYKSPLNHLPRSLKKLFLMREITQPLDKLPSSLCDLFIGFSYYHLPLDKLPSSLRSLTFYSHYNHPIDHLPDALTELCLESSHLDQPLDHLPRQLQVLKLSSDFNHPLDHLPPELQVLKLGSKFDQPLDRLPDALTQLQFDWMSPFNRPLRHIPPALQTLKFGSSSPFNHPLNHLPNSVANLQLGDQFNQPFVRLPRSLTYLSLGDSFNHPLPLVRPDPSQFQPATRDLRPPSSNSDAAIDLKDSLHADVTSRTLCIPTALGTLCLGKSFNQPLLLPPSLTKLDVLGAFSHPLPIDALPAKLTFLQVSLIHHPQLRDIFAVRRQCPFVQISGLDSVGHTAAGCGRLQDIDDEDEDEGEGEYDDGYDEYDGLGYEEDEDDDDDIDYPYYAEEHEDESDGDADDEIDAGDVDIRELMRRALEALDRARDRDSEL